jgi:hypothetical protein
MAISSIAGCASSTEIAFIVVFDDFAADTNSCGRVALLGIDDSSPAVLARNPSHRLRRGPLRPPSPEKAGRLPSS